MPTNTALIAGSFAIVGALIAGLFTVIGIALGGIISVLGRRHQQMHESRIAKSERLTEIYSDLIAAAWVMADATMVDQWTQISLDNFRTQKLVAGDNALPRLAIETDAQDVRTLYKNVTNNYQKWRRNQSVFLRYSDEDSDCARQEVQQASETMRASAEAIDAHAHTLEEQARKHIASLRVSERSWWSIWDSIRAHVAVDVNEAANCKRIDDCDHGAEESSVPFASQ